MLSAWLLENWKYLTWTFHSLTNTWRCQDATVGDSLTAKLTCRRENFQQLHQQLSDQWWADEDQEHPRVFLCRARGGALVMVQHRGEIARFLLADPYLAHHSLSNFHHDSVEFTQGDSRLFIELVPTGFGGHAFQIVINDNEPAQVDEHTLLEFLEQYPPRAA